MTGNPWDDYAAQPKQAQASGGNPWDDYGQQVDHPNDGAGGFANQLGASTGSTINNVLNNATLGGYDHFRAGLASAIPSNVMAGGADVRLGDYGGNLEKIRAQNKAIDSQVPIAAGASKLAGSVLGYGKLSAASALPSQMAGKAAAATAPKLAGSGGRFIPSTAGAGLDAAVIGGAQAAIEGRDALKEAKQGGVSAMALNTLLRGAGPVAAAFRRPPKSPNTSQIQSAKNAAYDDSFSRGVTYDPAQIGKLADDVQALAPQQGLKAVDGVSHPMTHNAVNKLRANRNAPQSLEDLDSFRSGLSASRDNGPDAHLISKIRGAVDGFIDTAQPAQVLRGGLDDAIKSIKESRGLNRRFKQSQALDEIDEKVMNSAAKKGGRSADAIQSALRTVLNSPKQRQQFDQPHLEAMRKLVRGDGPRNIASRAGNVLNPLNRQNMAVSGYGMSTPFAPVILAANGLGLAGRATSNRLVKRDYEELAAAIRNGTGQPITQGQVEGLLRNPELRGMLAVGGGVQNTGAN